MNTIGKIIKDARIAKKYSLKHIEGMTKIKSNFIDAIEREDWEKLPPFPTVLGFVKSLAGALEVNSNMLVAVLKRDYPPKKLRVSPKPDVSKKFIWSPKLTFFLSVFMATSVLLVYLIFQYLNFISLPKLTVESPKENQIVTSGLVTVFGTTDSDAKITINNQPIIVSDEGQFSEEVKVTKETKELVITASSRSGKTTSVSRKIQTE